ncbi:hypothetical protein [Peribacillus loiseleuriae]|uniref:hypothetical protein n=1 Tax=Peribacillus loiseleuriae TaxID=1679170 RepID=UPI003CFC762D
MNKAIVLGCLLLLFCIPTTTFAAEACGKPLVSDEEYKNIEEYKETDANMAEKFIVGQVENLFHIGDINSLSSLIYGNPYCVWTDKDQKLAPDGIFTTDERSKIIDPILKMFSSSYVFLLTLAILISSLKLGLRANNPQIRSGFWEDMNMWIASALFVVAYLPVTNVVFELNSGITQSIKDLLTSNGVKVDGVSIISNWKDALTLTPGLSLILTFLMEWILSATLNIIYIARKIIIMLLLIMGYVAAYSLIFPKTRAFFGTWFKELLSNVFLQSIHAIVLYAFAMMSHLGAGVFMKLGLMMMFIPVSGMIARWVNASDSSSKLGQAVTMMGLGGVMSTMMLSKQAGNIIRGGGNYGSSNSTMNSNPFSSSNLSTKSGDISAGGSIMNAGGGSDASFTNITASSKGANSNSWNTAKTVAGTVGGAILGTAGSVLGPQGAAVGAMVGNTVSQGVMQGSRNVSSGVYNSIQTVKGASAYEGVGGTGVKGMMNDLSARRSFFGNMGESVGSVIGAGGIGRSLGHAFSGVSRQRLSSTLPEFGGSGVARADGSVSSMSWNELAKIAPNAEVRFAQTNSESSYWWKNPSGQWNRMGNNGAADPTLKDGAVRMMNYKLSDLPVQGGPKITAGSTPGSNMLNSLTSGSTPISGMLSNNVPNGQSMGGGSGALTRPEIQGGSTPSSSVLNPTSGSIPISGASSNSVTFGEDVGGEISFTRPEMQGGSASGSNVLNPLLSGSNPISSGSSNNVSFGEEMGGASLQLQPNGTYKTITTSVNSNGDTRTTSELAGLSGSTPNLMRTSDSYITGGGSQNGAITREVMNAPITQSISDPGFKGSSVNPDAFVSPVVSGVDIRSKSDRVADSVHLSKVNLNNAAGWMGNKIERSKSRNREVI